MTTCFIGTELAVVSDRTDGRNAELDKRTATAMHITTSRDERDAGLPKDGQLLCALGRSNGGI